MSARTVFLGTAAAVAAVIQVYPPVVLDNPPPSAEISAPSSVDRVLRRSCYDCHSNETRWPSYSKVAPASWLVAKDVHDARLRMNFSKWPQSVPPEIDCLFKRRIAERADNGEMPPLRYRLLHPSAAVTEEDAALLQKWATEECDHES